MALGGSGGTNWTTTRDPLPIRMIANRMTRSTYVSNAAALATCRMGVFSEWANPI